MATISFTTTARQDEGAQWKAAQHNTNMSQDQQLTAVAYVRQRLFHMLDGWADEMDASTRLSRVEAYKLLTPEEKAIVDPILDAHR